MRLDEIVENVLNTGQGDQVENEANTEFNKGVARKWAKDAGIKLITLPARGHSKAGPVVREYRVLKDALGRIKNDEEGAKLPFDERFSEACFIRNIFTATGWRRHLN